MSEVIVVTSGKGGVGKTTTTANIGAALAKLGFKVLLIDTDLGLRNLDVIMGLENRIIYNIVDVIEGKCKASQAIVKDKSKYERIIHCVAPLGKQYFHDTGMVWTPETAADGNIEQLAPDWRYRLLVAHRLL